MLERKSVFRGLGEKLGKWAETRTGKALNVMLRSLDLVL